MGLKLKGWGAGRGPDLPCFSARQAPSRTYKASAGSQLQRPTQNLLCFSPPAMPAGLRPLSYKLKYSSSLPRGGTVVNPIVRISARVFVSLQAQAFSQRKAGVRTSPPRTFFGGFFLLSFLLIMCALCVPFTFSFKQFSSPTYASLISCAPLF